MAEAAFVISVAGLIIAGMTAFFSTEDICELKNRVADLEDTNDRLREAI